jgi:hypothetical protein
VVLQRSKAKLICATIVMAILCAVGSWLIAARDPPFLAVCKVANDRGQLCGARALYHALSRLGFEATFRTLVEKLDVGAKHTTMQQLKALANQIGVSANGSVLSWDELRRLEGVAILFVDQNNFFTVDPRETPPELGAEQVRVYDAGPAEWWDRERLQSIWRGEALVVSRQRDRSASQKGRISFDAVLEDVGAHKSGIVKATYRFVNGGSEVKIKEIKTSCGCAAASASQSTIEPGGSAAITLEVDLSQLKGRGAFETSAIVLTNEPEHWAHKLTVQGRVIDTGRITADKLFLGDMRRGATTVRHLVVRDAGDGTGKLLEYTANLGRGNKREVVENELRVELTARKWVASEEFEKSNGGRVSGGRINDFVVQVSVHVSPTSRPGPVSGKVFLVVERGREISKVVVPLIGDIPEPVVADPPAILMVLAPEQRPESTITRRIVFSSDTPITLEKVEAQNVPFSVVIESACPPVAIVSCRRSAVKERRYEGELRCSFSNGADLVVPCQLINAPQP